MNNRSKGIALSYINTALNMVCGLFLSAFLLRMLGDTEYGIYQTVSAFASYLVLFEFGTGTVMTRNLSMCFGRNATRDEIERNVSTIWTITNALAIVIAIVSLGFFFSMGSIYSKTMTEVQIAYGKKIFAIMTVFLIVSFYTQTVNGIILACEKYTFSSAVSTIKIVLRTTLLVGLISAFRYSIIIAIVDTVLSIFIAIFTYFFCLRKCSICLSLKHFDNSIFRAALPLCLAIFMQTIVNQANNNVDKFLIGVMMSPEMVTLYGVGMYIYNVFSSLTTIPISMYAPQVIKGVGCGLEKKELADTLIRPSRLIVLIGGNVLFGYIAAGRQFISIVYGDSYGTAWLIALVIMVPMFINMSNGIIINVLDALGKRIYRSVILTFTTVANIVLTFWWVKVFGVIGAAIATAVCTFCGQVVLMNIYYYKKIKIPVIYLFVRSYRGILLYQIFASLCAYVIGISISNKYLSFFVAIVSYLALFLVGFLVIGKNEEEKIYLKKFFRRRNDKNI